MPSMALGDTFLNDTPFNTVNKLAAGITDNYATGLLCEALASRTPITIAPMVNNRLWPHPAWQHNHLDLL
jgi:phosphopantothenoylcysteine synthetase/decarboxylase